MSEGVRIAWITATASVLAAVLGAFLGRPVINEVVGTTDKIERLTEENQTLREEASRLKVDFEVLKKRKECDPQIEPRQQKSTNIVDLAARLAEEKETQVLALGASVRGAIADDATREYVFLGTANSPLLFILEQPSKHFWAVVDVYDSQGRTHLRNKGFVQRRNEITFTPPHDDAFILRLKGTRNFGEYLIFMTLLEEADL